MGIEMHEDEALQGFVEQSLDKLDQIETALIKLENEHNPSPASVAPVYGLLVSLKESAALLELRNISLVAGKIGQILDGIYKNEIKLSSEILNLIIDSFDKLNEMVSNATHSEDYDARIVTLAIEEIVRGETGVEVSEPEQQQPVTSKEHPAAEIIEESKAEPQPEPAPQEQPQEVSAPPRKQSKPKNISAIKFRKKYGIKHEIDLASNANPLGVSKAVANTIVDMANNCTAFDMNTYESLKFGLAKRHDIPEDSIVIGNSSLELLDLILRTSVSPGTDHILNYDHGLPTYSRVAALCGVDILRVPRGRNFSPPLDHLVTSANNNTAAVIITNPDIPSGYGVPAEELATMANLLPKRTLLIIDEKYVEFAWPEDDYSMAAFLSKAPNLVILRSFSWSFGLKGVSLGYALMHPEKAKLCEESRLPDQISPLNLGAGLAALNHNEFCYSTITMIIRGRERIEQGLQKLGCTVYPSQANFVMFSAPIPAREVYTQMLEYGFRLHHLEEFDLDDLLVVSIGNHSRNRMFLAAMQNIF